MAKIVLDGDIDARQRVLLEGAGHVVADQGEVVLRFGRAEDDPKDLDAPVLEVPPSTDDVAIELQACLDALGDGPELDMDRMDRMANMLGSDERMHSFVGIYIAEGREHVNAIRTAAHTGDARRAHRAAHSLKPTSGMIGALALEQACRSLEDHARKGDMIGALGRAAAITWLFGQAARRLEAAWASSS